MAEVLKPPQHVATFVERSCANCHSNQTHWPWYSRMAPFSWLVTADVNQARSAMNFSEWDRQPVFGLGALSAACADLERGRMPPARYLLLHPEARPSAEEVREFCGWTRSQVATLTARLARQRPVRTP